MVLKCSCQNAYQDRKYGSGNRVHNPRGGKNKGSNTTYRCTICKAERGASGMEVAKK